MKPSSYNYYQPYEGGVIFLNGLTEASFWVENSKVDTYKTLIEYPADNYDNFSAFIDRMKRLGFVVDKDVDEFSLVSMKYEALKRKHEYRIMILPTYACNLRCWYCVQEHKDEWLQPAHFEAIGKLIRRNIESEEIKSLSISWFGGEPLLAYDHVREFTAEMKRLAESMSKQFRCDITTNGTLLTSERIRALREAGVTSYQITIDGCKEDHDKVKQLGQLLAYERTMGNIAELAKDTYCILRHNYSPSSLRPKEILDDVLARIPQEVRRNIQFNLQPVWQENFTEADFKKVVGMMQRASDSGMPATHKTGGLCYVDFAHYDCVYPSGEVGKCENDVTKMRNGKLFLDGNVDMSYADTQHYIFNPTEKNSECSDCTFLPICWGPCSRKRYLQLQQYGEISCEFLDKKRSMAELVRNIYLSHINSSLT